MLLISTPGLTVCYEMMTLISHVPLSITYGAFTTALECASISLLHQGEMSVGNVGNVVRVASAAETTAISGRNWRITALGEM